MLEPEAFDAMLPYLKNEFGNPSSIHRQGRKAKIALEQSRKTIAWLLGAEPKQIVFTGSGTEANNTAIASALQAGRCRRIITSPIEHHAVLHTIEHYAKMLQVPVSFVRLKPNGDIDLNDLEKQLQESGEPCLVSLMHANNELGNATDIIAIGNLSKESGAVFHSDCVQTIGHFRITASFLAVDFIAGSAHKFHGPKGTGLLYARNPDNLLSLIHGGGHERNHRAGTENVAGIVGMAKALEIAMKRIDQDQKNIQLLKSTLVDALREKIPGIAFNGDISTESLYTVVNVSFPLSGQTDDLVTTLDIEGISVSGGSACAGGATSHVISALGGEADRVAIRFSFSRFNTMDEIDFIINKLVSVTT